MFNLLIQSLLVVADFVSPIVWPIPNTTANQPIVIKPELQIPVSSFPGHMIALKPNWQQSPILSLSTSKSHNQNSLIQYINSKYSFI